MTLEQLRNCYDAQPFQPFIMHLADGRHIPVRHREFLATAPDGRTIAVFQADEKLHIVDLRLVTDLEVESASSPGNASN